MVLVVGSVASAGGTPYITESGITEPAAFATLVAQLAASVVVLPGGNTEIEAFRYMYELPGTVLQVEVQGWVQHR